MVHRITDPEADWADAILGTDSCVHDGLSHSLQAEVDVYFNDISSASYSSVMTFWQVSDTISYFLILSFHSLFLGEPAPLSYDFYACNGCVSHPRLCSAM